MPDIIRVRFATNRNPVSGPELFGPKFRDSGWVPEPDSVQVDPPIDAAIYESKFARQTRYCFIRPRSRCGRAYRGWCAILRSRRALIQRSLRR